MIRERIYDRLRKAGFSVDSYRVDKKTNSVRIKSAVENVPDELPGELSDLLDVSLQSELTGLLAELTDDFEERGFKRTHKTETIRNGNYDLLIEYKKLKPIRFVNREFYNNKENGAREAVFYNENLDLVNLE